MKIFKNFFKEFKTFAVKGNMIDMAVGIIIGGAFGTLVRSLVDDILMPVIAGIFQSPDFSNLFLVLRNPTQESFTAVENARESGAVVLAYGQFINAIIAFLLVAFALFLIIKTINKLKAKEEKKPEPSKGPSELDVLIEIRDMMKKQK